jgi:hypothetical protein
LARTRQPRLKGAKEWNQTGRHPDFAPDLETEKAFTEPDGLRTVREQISYGVLDPRCFANEGGTPIAEAIFKGGAF